MTSEQATALIGERFAGAQVTAGEPGRRSLGGGGLVVAVAPDQWAAFAQFAKETLGCRFFSFSSAVDWKAEGLEMVARVENLEGGFAVMMKTRLGPGVSTLASIAPIYRGANWMERECWDMFGIVFEGHPDLRRILLEDSWVGHPLLKSYAVDTPHPPYR